MPELDPIAAVTAADPYPFYACLIAERPFYHDDQLGTWVASSATAVEAVLSHPDLRVRPAAEPIPAALVGTPLGETFSQFARMTDGSGHAPLKRGASVALAALSAGDIAAASERSATTLLASCGTPDGASLATFVFGIPALTLASLLGFPPPAAEHTAAWTGALVRAMAPGGTQRDRAGGLPALAKLNETVTAEFQFRGDSSSLLSSLRDDGRSRGLPDSALIANAAGFLFQTYDATAALIGNSLVALARSADAQADLISPVARSTNIVSADDAESLRPFIEEVIRYDSPVQNTRRFAAAGASILGHEIRGGEAILIILAAANRDPAANPWPDRFDAGRAERSTFTFGLGAHACPGAALATTIARVAVSKLLESGIDLSACARPSYRPSGNVRVPDFAS